MKVALGIVAGISFSILVHIIWQPTIDRRAAERPIARLLTRIPPATHPDCKPKFRSWHNGAMTEGAW